MSTVERPKTLPPLIAGQRLDQATFHERYETMPPGTWAELVGGVVYMPSPLRYEHGGRDRLLAFWMVSYQKATPGVGGAANATVKLDDDAETQPDQILLIPDDRGGRSRIVDGYVVGSPELVVEVGYSSRHYDLNAKKAAYEKAGVLEYLFIGVKPDEVRWFVRRDGAFVERAPAEDGTYRSDAFPGLWLDPAALFAEDLDGLIAALDRGLATPEHLAFVARLAGGR